MSTHILSACWSLTGMSSTQKLVLISLADQANDDGVCWPSIPRMVERTCLSERAIRNAIEWLESEGHLTVQRRFNKSNLYTVTPSNAARGAGGARGAGVAASGAGLDRHDVPTNRNRTIKEPSVGDSRPAAEDQAYLDRVTRHERANQPVTMTTDWQPGEQFPALMMRAGMTADRLTDEILAKFVIHHNGTSKPQNKWEAALVTWCKREQAAPAKPANSGTVVYMDQVPAYREYRPPVLPERTPEMADLARQHISKLREALG